jgi:mannose-6-phosphate isomerase
MNPLYPLKFHPIYFEKVWGGSSLSQKLGKKNSLKNAGESWELVDFPEQQSIVKNGRLSGKHLNELIEIYQEELLGLKVWNSFGSTFPLLIKFIDARDDLSIQVHPDNKLAKALHGSSGKTEMWYVLEADEEAKIILGFKETITAEQYEYLVHSNTLKDMLLSHNVKKGDAFFIPAGLVHAIGGGIVLAEIQQPSDVTYRIYDYDRKDDKGNLRELHTEQALRSIDFALSGGKIVYNEAENEPVRLATCPYFTTNVIKINRAINCDYSNLKSFVVYVCTEGEGILLYDGGNEEVIGIGETVLIPASLKNIKIVPNIGMELLEVWV